MHKITIIGNLGRDPEMRYTSEGQAVVTFSVASSRKYKTSSGEQKEDTEWFNCSAFARRGTSWRKSVTSIWPRGNRCMLRDG